jgi:hypothetical protein
MYAMQYGFDFPHDFDMGSVRARVAEIGARFDELAGLHHKAFLVADRANGVAGRYAPFYLWRALDGMMAFLASTSFEAVVAKYGRPVVQGWHPLVEVEGEAVDEPPRFAVRQALPIAADVTLARLGEIEHERVDELAQEPALHSAFTGVDPEGWQLMRMTLWRSRPPASVTGRVFDVEYLARSRQPAGSVREAGR